MRALTEIIFHCSATQNSWMATEGIDAQVTEITRWHVEDRGWSDIGYHYIVSRQGEIREGRPLARTGAHVKGRNTGTIGICLIGGATSTENDKPEDNFTDVQLKAARSLAARLMKEHPTIKKVSGHNQYAAKACPGFQVDPWWKKKEPRGMMQSSTLQATAGVAVSGATGVVTAVSSLDSTAQYILVGSALVAAAGLAWIARERIKKWARGVQ